MVLGGINVTKGLDEVVVRGSHSLQKDSGTNILLRQNFLDEKIQTKNTFKNPKVDIEFRPKIIISEEEMPPEENEMNFPNEETI